MDKNKIEQKKPGLNQKGVEEDSPLRLTADLEGNYLLDERTSEMKWLGIFYSPAGGSVHRVAKMLKKKIGADKVDMFCVNDIQAGKLLDYKNLILVCSSLGRSTWEREQRDRWERTSPNDPVVPGRGNSGIVGRSSFPECVRFL